MGVPEDAENVPAVSSARLLALRLAIGLGQGLAVWLFFRVWDDNRWSSFWDVALSGASGVLLYLPPLIIIALRDLIASPVARRRLGRWYGLAAVIVWAIGSYACWRHQGDGDRQWRESGNLLPRVLFIDGWPIALLPAWLFIADVMVKAPSPGGRWRADYGRYFTIAWQQTLQILLALVLLILFRLIWAGGGELFFAVGLNFLRDWLDRDGIILPVMYAGFAACLHSTDVRPAMITGMRAILLRLQSWLLLPVVMVAGLFLLVLPFVPLRLDRIADGLLPALLLLSGVLVTVLNASYQDGTPACLPPPMVRWAGRAVGPLLVVLLILAACAHHVLLVEGRWLDKEGRWSPGLVMDGALLILLAVYAGGYSLATLRRGAWMRGLERTNITAAGTALLLGLLVMSPVADPERIRSDDLVHRLEQGVGVGDADYYRRLSSAGRFGWTALRHLATDPPGGNPIIAARAQVQLTAPWRRRLRPDETKVAVPPRSVTVYPQGKVLPPDFLASTSSANSDLDLCGGQHAACDAILIDLLGDGREEIILLQDQSSSPVYAPPDPAGDKTGTGWRYIGGLPSLATCPELRQALLVGPITTLAPRWRDLTVGGVRLGFRPRQDGATFCSLILQ